MSYLVVIVGHGNGLCAESFTDHFEIDADPCDFVGRTVAEEWLKVAAKSTGTVKAAIDEILVFKNNQLYTKFTRHSEYQF